MGIKIGNNNRIKNSVVSENSYTQIVPDKSNWMQRHPIISALIAAVLAGIILLLKFWNPIINFLDNLIGG